MIQNEGWQKIWGPTIDMTGDDFPDTCDQYGLMLVERFMHGTFTTDRETLIYMNEGKTVRMIATPVWHAASGNTYELTLSKKIG